MDKIAHLLIDDLRSFADGREATILRTLPEALAWLEANPDASVGTLYLDHDLGENPDTGEIMEAKHFTRELERRIFFNEPHPAIDRVLIHTSNRAAGGGAWEMKCALEKTYDVTVVDSQSIGLVY